MKNARQNTLRNAGQWSNFASKTCWKLYRVSVGIKSVLILPPCRQKAITVFCSLHNLFPAQVAVLYSYPFTSL